MYSHTSPYTPEAYKSFTENQAQRICGLAANYIYFLRLRNADIALFCVLYSSPFSYQPRALISSDSFIMPVWCPEQRRSRRSAKGRPPACSLINNKTPQGTRSLK